MLGKIKLSLFTWSLVMLAFITASKIEAKIEERTFPIPKAVVEKAVTSWLQASGFRVLRDLASKQGVDLRAEKETESWHIVIHPKSALASSVTADWTGPNDLIAPNPHKDLWDHISKQTWNPNADNDIIDNSIPVGVRSRLESVVCMRFTTDDGKQQFSGFFLDEREGLVISTAHDLVEFQEIIAEIDNVHEIAGQVILLDHTLDLALIRLEYISHAGILLTERRDPLHTSDRLYAIGCSTNCQCKVSDGIVYGPLRRTGRQSLWQVKMKILPGYSGGPVFDEQGRLVAVVKGRHRLQKSVGFLIPIETIIDFIRTNIDSLSYYFLKSGPVSNEFSRTFGHARNLTGTGHIAEYKTSRYEP